MRVRHSSTMASMGGSALTETDEGNKHANAGADSHDERLGHDAGKPLTDAQEGEDDEEPALKEDGRERLAVRYGPAPVKSDDRVRELPGDMWFNRGDSPGRRGERRLT